MKRLLYNKLLEWKRSERRKPLLLQGARQVGKTYLVNQFGKSEYTEFIYLNFEEKPNLRKFFEGDLTPQTIINNISLYLGHKITATNTLLFFDEIQIVPEVLISLKYFCEQASEYHIIAAGSLLGVSIGKSSGFPVGKVNFMTLYPLHFLEYLSAVGEDYLADNLINNQQIEPLPEPTHDKLLWHIKNYMFLGGMPEVLQNYLENKDIAVVREIQNEILSAYQRDFSKYTDKNLAIKISEVWHSIPYQLVKESKKFQYADVRKNSRASTYVQTIEWLNKAGLINIVYNISVPKLPLAGYADTTKFKIYMLDSGLLGAMLNLSSAIILEPNALFLEYKGAFTENFVASELVANGTNGIFYWTSGNDAEVDFIIQKENEVIPIEVKSGLSRNTKSIRSYADKYKPKMLYRLSPRNFIQSGNFVNLPLYGIGGFLKG